VIGSVVLYAHSVCSVELASNSSNEADNAEDCQNNKQALRRVRDSVMDMMIERTYDVSSYTRAAVLRTWVGIADGDALPLARFESVAEVAVDRLKDRTAAVRKNAISLLVSLLDNNPFGGTLNLSIFKKKQCDTEELLKQRLQQLSDTLADSSDIKKEVDEEEKPDEDEEAPEITEDNEIVAFRKTIEYCTSAIKFITLIEAGLAKIKQMLSSKTSSDIAEALKFISKSVKFDIDGSAVILQGAFSLIWHQEETIKKECLNAFITAYLSDGAITSDMILLPADQIASNLTSVSIRCTVSDLASLEKIIGLLFSENYLEDQVISSLWSIVSEIFCILICTLFCVV
jgi:condensin complex subunit 1